MKSSEEATCGHAELVEIAVKSLDGFAPPEEARRRAVQAFLACPNKCMDEALDRMLNEGYLRQGPDGWTSGLQALEKCLPEIFQAERGPGQ